MPNVLAPARIHRRHQANRAACVADMANWIVTQHAIRLPKLTYHDVVETALSFACGLTDTQWTELGERSGHYLWIPAAEPAQDTIADVLRHLEAMLPEIAAAADPFAGLS